MELRDRIKALILLRFNAYCGTAAINEVESSSARGLRLEHCGTFKFGGSVAAMQEPQCMRWNVHLMHCGGLCIAAAAMYDLHLPQLAGWVGFSFPQCRNIGPFILSLELTRNKMQYYYNKVF